MLAAGGMALHQPPAAEVPTDLPDLFGDDDLMEDWGYLDDMMPFGRTPRGGNAGMGGGASGRTGVSELTSQHVHAPISSAPLFISHTTTRNETACLVWTLDGR